MRPTTSSIGVQTVVAAVLALLLAACGGPAPAPVDTEAAERAQALLSEAPDDPSIVVFTVDLPNAYSPDELTAPPGDLTLVLDNQTLLQHNVVFEGIDDEARAVEAPGRGVFTGEITLEPGEYVFYCDIPGHRNQGMEGVLTVG